MIMFTQDGDSKYVANILSNMANGGENGVRVTYAVPAAAYASGVTTGTTATLTPTTLSNIEQTFIELQSVPATTTAHLPVTQSGFVPPPINNLPSDPEMYYSDKSSESDWSPAPEPKRVKIGDKTTTIMSQYEIENPRRKTHRRQLKNEQVSPEEAARRSLRRERNKLAAAKCRQRRVDHTNRLLNETDKLEQEQSDLEGEIKTLQQEKDQLEFILQAHSPVCKVAAASSKKVKVEQAGSKLPCSAMKKDLSSLARPSTLPLMDMKSAVKVEKTSTGVSLTTPSNGFYNFSLDTMVDHTGLTPLTGALGHTGLTPITNGPVSCSSEVKRVSSSSDSSEGVRSPASLISL